MKEYKIVMLGSNGVGKTALTVQFVQGIFAEQYDPTIQDNYRKTLEADGEQRMIEIVDTTKTEAIDENIRNGQGFALIYAINEEDTFDEIKNLHDRILRVKKTHCAPIIIVGNKCDLEENRIIIRREGYELAFDLQVHFTETSAKNNMNVSEIFSEVVGDIDIFDEAKLAYIAKSRTCSLL